MTLLIIGLIAGFVAAWTLAMVLLREQEQATRRWRHRAMFLEELLWQIQEKRKRRADSDDADWWKE